jgi:hypothetical protein
MFNWLKKKANLSVQKTCKFNITLSTKTLVSIANRADANLRASGYLLNKSDQQEVVKAQKSLLTDIFLGHKNGMSLDEIKFSIINPLLADIQVSEGAQRAVDHVINSAAKELGI